MLAITAVFLLVFWNVPCPQHPSSTPLISRAESGEGATSCRDHVRTVPDPRFSSTLARSVSTGFLVCCFVCLDICLSVSLCVSSGASDCLWCPFLFPDLVGLHCCACLLVAAMCNSLTVHLTDTSCPPAMCLRHLFSCTFCMLQSTHHEAYGQKHGIHTRVGSRISGWLTTRSFCTDVRTSVRFTSSCPSGLRLTQPHP